MKRVIERLTPEQEAAIPRFHERWRAIGLSTEPVDPSMRARPCGRSGIMSAFRGLRSLAGHRGAPGRSLLTLSGLSRTPRRSCACHA